MMGAITMFADLPQFQAMGRKYIQMACREWLKTPDAAEFGVITGLIVHEDLSLDIQVGMPFAKDKEVVRFPADRLAYFVVDHARWVNRAERENFKRELASRWERYPDVFRSFVVNLGGKLPKRG